MSHYAEAVEGKHTDGREQTSPNNKAWIKNAIYHLNMANSSQQKANIQSDDEEDVCYEIHNAIENIINTLEEYAE